MSWSIPLQEQVSSICTSDPTTSLLRSLNIPSSPPYPLACTLLLTELDLKSVPSHNTNIKLALINTLNPRLTITLALPSLGRPSERARESLHTEHNGSDLG